MKRFLKLTLWGIAAVVSMGVAIAVVVFATAEDCAHEYVSSVTQPTTCHTPGVQTHTCRLCQHSYTTSIDLCDHTYDQGTVIIPADCFRNGQIIYRCQDCPEVAFLILERQQHVAGEILLVSQASCSHPGEEVICCANCQTEYCTQELPVNQVHNMVLTVEKKPNCKRGGYGHQICRDCGMEEDVQLPQTDHNFVYYRQHRSYCWYQGEYIEWCTYCLEPRVTRMPLDPNNHYMVNGWGYCMGCHQKVEEATHGPGTSEIIVGG